LPVFIASLLCFKDVSDVAEVYSEYQGQLRLNNSLDFDDLLLFCEDLLTKHPSITADIQHVLVDEFQV
jgi:DNA helicase-2/ATP-dependent DNA helicase PcrA